MVGSYLKQQMHFFVAKVNLKRHAASQSQTLKPLQVAYETPKFMLPIRLGTVNAKGPQDLSIFAITRTGRVETTNYPTVKLPTGMQLPVYLEQGGRFGTFYQAMFKHQAARHQNRAVFLEYAWNMSWCDPCSAQPLNNTELRGLGAFWLKGSSSRQVYLTRLHVRYDGDHFPEDLRFQVTGNTRELPGALRDAGAVEGRAGRLPRGGDVLRPAGEAAPPAGQGARRAHRVEGARRSRSRWASRATGPPRPRRPTGGTTCGSEAAPTGRQWGKP